jgi:hypothetical protein
MLNKQRYLQLKEQHNADYVVKITGGNFYGTNCRNYQI